MKNQIVAPALFSLLLLLPLPLHANQKDATERAAVKTAPQKGKSSRSKSRPGKPVNELARLREEYIKATNEYQTLLKKQLPGRERNVERAQDQVTKMQQLFAEGLISKQDLAASELALNEAKNKVTEISQAIANADSRIADTLLEAEAEKTLAKNQTDSERRHGKHACDDSLQWRRQLGIVRRIQGAAILPGHFQETVAGCCLWPGCDSRSLATGSSQRYRCLATS